MQTHIRNFRARYRLPASADGERRRLDGALAAALGGPLEDELARLGISEGEEVCVRDVFIPARLRLSDTDASLARAWGRAIAEAIARAVEGRSVAGVVRYASRLQALVDMAEGVALEDLSRSWAWRQLGLWSAPERATRQEAVDELVNALASKPSTITPMVVTLVECAAFRLLAPRFTRAHWRTLAAAASAAAGVRGVSELLGGPPPPPEHEQASPGGLTPPGTFTPEAMREAERAVSVSRIAGAFAHSHAWARGEDVQRAFAVLVILESNQPALSRRGGDAHALVSAAVLALKLRMEGRAPVKVSEGDGEPGGARRGESGGARPAVSPAEDASGVEAAGAEARGRERGGREKVFETAAPGEERPLPAVRRRAFTRFGGLLFLLGLLEDLGMAQEMSGDEVLRGRTLRWSLHRLALTLVPGAGADDPAALAFAGLAPDAPPPSEGEDGPSDEESGALDSYAGRVVGALRERLEERRDEPRETLLGYVCGRRAEVIADPGWLEVLLSLDDVDMDIRRSGLDLDPGYLRWLGVVVKFVYE